MRSASAHHGGRDEVGDFAATHRRHRELRRREERRAMRLVVERIEGRIAALDRAADRREAVEQVHYELLPLDDERRVENEVWLAFTARALVDPGLRAQHNEVYDALHQACASAIETLAAAGRADAGAATALQAERLHALCDGLAVHTALRPDLMPPERILAVVRLHLDALDKAASPTEPTASL
jgi:BetI-type transcriptional repressor, C-terminal